MGVSSPGIEPMGLNEDEPQLMSPVKKYNRRRRVDGVTMKADADSAGNRGALSTPAGGVAGTSQWPITDKAGRSVPMMEGQGHQPVEQAGMPGKAAGVGAEVGGVRSNKEEGDPDLWALSLEGRALWKYYSDPVLHQRYGLWALPTTARHTPMK